MAVLALVTTTVRAENAKIQSPTRSKSKPGGQIVVEVDRGSIEVKTADAPSVDIEVIRKAGGSDATATKILKDHVVTMTQNGNKVEVHAKYNGEKLTSWFGFGWWLQADLQCEISNHRSPQIRLDLKCPGGRIEVAELTGKVQHALRADLQFEKITGPVSGHTSGGSITATDCKGTMEIKTSGGSLHLSDIEGDVNARTSGGSIHADNLTGESVLKTSGGSIKVSGIRARLTPTPLAAALKPNSAGNPPATAPSKPPLAASPLLLVKKSRWTLIPCGTMRFQVIFQSPPSSKANKRRTTFRVRSMAAVRSLPSTPAQEAFTSRRNSRCSRTM